MIQVEIIYLKDSLDIWRDKFNKMISQVRSIEEYPDQTDKSGYVLSTNGTNVEWIPKKTIFDEFGINTGDGTATVFPAGISVGNFVCNIDSLGNVTTSGNIKAVNITATGSFYGNVSGNATTATTLKTARTIDGISFNGSANITHYGTCSTAAATAAKVVTCSGFTLATGSRVQVTFSNTNTANLSAVTLNVNNTGAKQFYIPGSNGVLSSKYVNGISGLFAGGKCVYTLVYNGTAYQIESISYGQIQYFVGASSAISLNNCIYTGRYYLSGANNVTNRPNGSTGWLDVFTINPTNASYLKQIWYQMDTNGTNDYYTYERVSNGTSWSSWKRFLMDSGNNTINGSLTVTGAIQGNSTITANGNLVTKAAFSAATTGSFGGNLTCAGAINAAGNITGNKVLNAVYNDYAEYFERGEETVVGDIIALDTSSEHERYVKATTELNCVVGVHSDTYGHIVGGENAPEGEDFEEHNNKNFIPVGMTGRVKVKVIGPVYKGQKIALTDIPGVGIGYINENETLNATIIGFAVETNTDESVKLVKVKI